MQFLGWNAEQWIDLGISASIIVGALLVGHLILRKLLGRWVRRLIDETGTSIGEAVLIAMRPPLYWLLLLLAFKAALNRLDFIPESFLHTLDPILYFLDVAIIFIIIGRLIHSLLGWYAEEIAVRTETDLDEQLLPYFRRLVLVLLGFIASITLLSRFIDVTALITTLGVGSLAIALAAQEALADAISGFLIMIDRPFRIGDRIEIQELQTWGDVVDIGLRSTHIRTRDNRMVIVPNSTIGKSLVINHSYPDTQYRIQIHVGVAYGSDLEQVRRTLVAAVSKVEGVLADKPVEALFLEFGDFSLIFRVRWWLETYVDTRQMFDRVNTAMYNALNAAGINIPFPQQDVHIKYMEKPDAGA